MNGDIDKRIKEIFQRDQLNISRFQNDVLSLEDLSNLQNENLKEFIGIVRLHGFPYKNVVSYETYKQAVALALHAAPEVLAEIALLFDSQSDPSLIDLEHKAYFVDKLRLIEGKPQMYGTQFTRNIDGTITFREIEGIEGVNDRRKSLGMTTLEKYKTLAES